MLENDATTPPWLDIARQETGVKRFAPCVSNPRIEQYHNHTNIAGYDDKAAWCSSFLNWVFAQVGIRGTQSALARSWLDWGCALKEPRTGVVVVLELEDPAGWQGHVGLFIRTHGDSMVLVGGNQLDEVREHRYPRSSLIGFRWPAR